MAAGDFTNIRVESDGPTSTQLRFTYAGALEVTVWRALSGGAFSQIAVFPTDYPPASGSPFNDDSVVHSTIYEYKLSDDGGSTFTSAVTVKTQKQFRIDGKGKSENIETPVFVDDESVNATNMQRLSEEVQVLLNQTVQAKRVCRVCPSDGALILDCTEGCEHFVVFDVTDINSISMECESATITFEVPEGTEIEICGWPQDRGFDGDECFQAPVSSPVVGMPSPVKPDDGCPVTARRTPAHPCTGEHTKDCYSKGSLQWTGSKFNFSLSDCVGAGATGCCSGNNAHARSGTGSALVWSGKDQRLSKADPGAGYSMLFGRSGSTPSLPWDMNIEIGIAKVVGQPIFGVAVNVPPTATMTNFTGLVLMLDYNAGLVRVGTYSGANLLEGDLPTLRNSAAISGTPAFFFMENAPPSGIYQIYNSSFATLYSFSDAGQSGGSTDLLGVGFFWVGSEQFGQHAARFQWPDDSSFITIIPH